MKTETAQLPVVDVVVTHHNRTIYLKQTLEAILAQTYEKLTVTVVDDFSHEDEYARVEMIVTGFPAHSIRLIRNTENIGQLRSFYRGLDERSGTFCCLVDPDDVVLPDYLTRMVTAHSNPNILAPVACCEQFYVNEAGERISSVITRHRRNALENDDLDLLTEMTRKWGYSRFFGSEKKGWLWSTSSSIMLRRAAVQMIRPCGPTPFRRAADSYLARGCHLLGGTIYLSEALVERRLHPGNGYITENYCSFDQRTDKKTAEQWSRFCLLSAIEAFFENGSDFHFNDDFIMSQLRIHTSRQELAYLILVSPGTRRFLAEFEDSFAHSGEDIITQRLLSQEDDNVSI